MNSLEPVNFQNLFASPALGELLGEPVMWKRQSHLGRKNLTNKMGLHR